MEGLYVCLIIVAGIFGGCGIGACGLMGTVECIERHKRNEVAKE